MQKLSTDEIGKSYKGRQVVRGVNLEVCQGEVVGLLGPNGAGKTTSFYMIVGLIAPDTGQVFVDDIDITRVPMYLRARQYGISYLPQEPSVFRKLSVEENILAVLEVQSISLEVRRARTEKLLDQLNLGHIRKTRGYALSGGERRRVEIARCLCIQPSFILLDEPFSGIDPIAVLDLQEIIFDLKASGIGVLHVTANAGHVELLHRGVSWIVPVLELSLVAAVIAYVAGIAAARRLGAKLASFTGIAEVIFAVLYAWLLLGQLPSPMEFAGGALMLAGVILVRVDETKRRALT